MKKTLSFLLACIMVISLLTASIVPISASTTNAYGWLSSTKYARAYALNSTGKTIPYTTSALRVRGNSTGSSSSAYIDNASDEVYILSVKKNSSNVMYAKVTYPTSKGRVTAYVKLSDFVSSSTTSHEFSSATGKFYVALRRGRSVSSSNYVSKGDTVYRLSSTAVNGKYQIMYPVSNGYRIAWCNVSDYNKYCGGGVNATSIRMDYTSISLSSVNSTRKLTYTITPANATNRITWSSNNTKVAVVSSSGTVSAVGNGTATITARTSNGKTATATVRVSGFATAATKITLNSTSFNLTNTSKTKQLIYTLTPANATNTVSWNTSNAKVASVSSSGKVTAVGNGTATITAKTSNGKTATATVRVSDFATALSSIKINSSNFTLTGAGTSKQLQCVLSPTGAKADVTWSATGTAVIVSGSGLVRAVGNGTSYVKATAKSGNITKTAQVKVTCTGFATSMRLNYSSVTLKGAGKTLTLKATLSPTSTQRTDKVIWISSNPSVAKFDSTTGVVTAVSNGTATITARTAANVVKSVTVKVEEDNVLVSSAEINRAAQEYGISTNSNAYQALLSINTKYESTLRSSKTGTLVFMFEGVGTNSSANKRMNAMCVVIKNGSIVYLSKNCSTIPDYPFNPAKNENTDMPTTKSGVYNFTTVNHRSEYAALNVSNAKVVRFKADKTFYSDTSYGINVHRRSSDNIAASSATWVNSAGCLLVGKAGASSTSEYAKFIKAVGIVGASATGTSKYATSVKGKIVIDRTYAKAYLKSVGYSDSAIEAIG